MLVHMTERDARSRTGLNLRNIMIRSGRYDIKDLVVSDFDSVPYHPMEDSEWRIEYLEHLMEAREERGLDLEEQEWLQYLCCD